MKVERLVLKDYFPQLGEEGAEAYVDCYIPEIMTEMVLEREYRPCLVVCPGGGYEFVSTREAEPVAVHFLSEGYCVFTVKYSEKPYHFPQQLRELAGVMELIYSHAEEWKCDTNDIAIMGFSAGGHLSAQYANRYDCPEVREVFPESKPVQKNVLCYPVITDEEAYTHGLTIRNYVGYEPTKKNEKGCSCECLVTEKTPPTFLWHTRTDGLVPVQNSLIYARELSEKGVDFELHIYPHGEHGLSTVDELCCAGLDEKTKVCHQWLTDCKRWLKN